MTGLALLNKSGHKFRLSLAIAVASFLWTIALQAGAVPEDDVLQRAVNYVFTGKIDPDPVLKLSIENLAWLWCPIPNSEDTPDIT
jgi:hypothetical protein